MCYPLMLCKLASVIRCDRLEMLSHVGQQQPPYRLDQRIAFLPYLSFPMMRKFVLRSTIVRMALLSLSTMKPISQSPNQLPSASLGRSCMFTLFLMPGAWSHACTGGCGDTLSCVGSLRQAYRLRCCGSSCKWFREISSHLPLPSSRISVWETLLPSDELFYTPGERLTHGTVPRSTMHTAPRKDIGLVPDILTVHCRIAS